MIEPIEMYGCWCDECGEYWMSFDGIMAYPDKSDVADYANRDGWREVDGKWYCPCCFAKHFEEDEETGEIKRKEEKK